MNKKDDIQKKIVEFQILDTNLKMLQEKAGLVNQKLEDLQRTKIAIDDLKDAKPSKALVPLGSGNFVYGSVENCDDIIVGIGSDVAVKKKREKALEFLGSRIKDLESDLNTVLKQSSVFVMQLEKVQQEIESLQK
jgi:prefoldin alpha subunit